MSGSLIGTGSSLPPRVVTNRELEQRLNLEPGWIFSRTGIRERRHVDAEHSSSSLALGAAQQAIAAAGMRPRDVDLIVCATVTPDHMTPSTACVLQHQLGCRTIPAFDVSAACSGFLYALAVADHWLQPGRARNVLVVGAEVLSRALDFNDRNSCILFGDGAGAIVLGRDDSRRGGIKHLQLGCDGSGGNLITVPSMITPKTESSSIYLDGRPVFRLAVQRMTELVQAAIRDLERFDLKLGLIVPHQVNMRIIAAMLEACHLPVDKVFVNLDRIGNTSAASIPMALDEAVRTGKVQRGEAVLMVAFGGGLTWGSCILVV